MNLSQNHRLFGVELFYVKSCKGAFFLNSISKNTNSYWIFLCNSVIISFLRMSFLTLSNTCQSIAQYQYFYTFYCNRRRNLSQTWRLSYMCSTCYKNCERIVNDAIFITLYCISWTLQLEYNRLLNVDISDQ